MEIKISDYFSEKEVSSLTSVANHSEELGKLTLSAVDLLHDKQLLDLFVPQRYNGLQYELPSALPWIEATSWIDGSLGWTLTLASGAGFFGAFMNPDFAQSFFDKQDAFIAGSGFPGGKAEKDDSGFNIKGKWKYASGIDYATLITATSYLVNDGNILHHNGQPVTKAVALYPDEVEIHQSWDSMGLKATGSHNFEVRDVQIPEERVFSITPNAIEVDATLYRYPFEAFAHGTLAISFLGIARRFFYESKKLLLSQDDANQLQQLSKSLQEQFEKHI